jgi:tetratricopeptide (TPR) repeat protein
MYFSAAPAVVLFWPWHALTGAYVSHAWAVAIFTVVGFLAGAWLFCEVRQKYFSSVGNFSVIGGMAAYGLAGGVTTLLYRPDVWEVPIACSHAMAMLALLAVWRALHAPATRTRWLAAASLAYGLAIASRPSVLFGAVILAVPLVAAWREGKTFDRGALNWQAGLAVVLPIGAIGIAVACYNLARFGSVFEFGQHYQLAADRQDVARHFDLSYFWFNFRLYFLEPATWSAKFPFVGGVRLPPLPPGHGAVEGIYGIFTNTPVALFALVLPVAWWRGMFAAHGALRSWLLATALLFAAVAGPLCLFYGTCARYEFEFQPMLTLLAVIGFWSAETWARAERWRFFTLGILGGVFLMFSIVFSLLRDGDHVSRNLTKMGFDLGVAGRQLESQELLTLALRLRPHDSEAHFAVGYLAASSGQAKTAIEHLQAALERAPDYVDAHVCLGQVLAAQPGRQAEALMHYDVAQRLMPDSPEAHNNMALLLASMPGRQAEAVAHYEAALRLNPEFATAHYNLALFLASQPNRQADALTHYEAALRLRPDYWEAHNNLGLLLANLPGRQAEALVHMESALRLKPDFPEGHFNYALVRATQPGGQADAVAHFETAVRLRPDSARLRFDVGLQFEKMKDHQADARREFEATLKIDPNHAAAREALARLARSNQ